MMLGAFTDQEQDFLVHCLSIAAERFDADAKITTDACQPRLAEQFTRQAQQARDLRDRIEEGA